MSRRCFFSVLSLIVSALLALSCATGGASSVCGNGRCEQGEDAFACPADCGAYCGNQICQAGESVSSCPSDCYCGNGTCDPEETTASCAADCPSTQCGDGTCAAGETTTSCPNDCYCGNSTCDSGETNATCAGDCPAGAYCGNDTCDLGETASNCPGDCGTCGNGICDAGETTASCSQDCTGCVHATCDLYPQCGCDTGDKCSVNASDQRACVTAGSNVHGSTCAQESDCTTGTICIGTGAADARCLQFCNDDANCPGDGGACVYQMVDASQNPIPGAEMCSKDCNPVTVGTTCPSGWTCAMYFVDANQDDVPDYWLTDCSVDAGSAATGAFCDATTFCTPGNWCYINATDTANTNKCFKNCRMGITSDCTSPATCTAYDPVLTIGSTQYGFCY